MAQASGVAAEDAIKLLGLLDQLIAAGHGAKDSSRLGGSAAIDDH